MTTDWLLIPVLANVLLAFVVQITMFRHRVKAIRKHKVQLREIVNRHELEQRLPEATAASNSYLNQFELPVIFYALMAFFMITQWAGWVEWFIACLFVISRMAHAYIHCTSNRLKYRFRYYVLGSFLLYGLFGCLVFRWLMHWIY